MTDGTRTRDTQEVAENSGREAERTSAGTSEYRAADRESGHIGEGTTALTAAADNAKRAAAAAIADNSRDERVPAGAESSSGDHRSDYLHVDEYGASDGPDSTDTAGAEPDVPRDTRSSKASRAAIEKRRREREQRIKQAVDE
ncbi:hypothetical protein, partial [uncultured Corynebacterium sp.]|uniref:hypothetical protein n=1 Tax=uncultured Corynebacterium sp. TaxID=159447 RepID=UPI00259852D2